MNIERFTEYCLKKKAVSETTPFGPNVLVLKVMEKMFAATSLDELEFRVNLKCNPELAIEYRAMYQDIIPGWHMNKVHWNTVYMERGLQDIFIMELIDHSYSLVVKSFTKKVRKEFDLL